MAPQVGSARSDWTRVVKVSRRKTNRRKTRLYCILINWRNSYPGVSLFLCFVRSSSHLSGYRRKSPIPFSTNLNLRDVSPCNVTRAVCSVFDPPRFETSPVCIVESELTMGTDVRDPPVIGKCFISKQERRSTRPDCKNVLKYVETNSKTHLFRTEFRYSRNNFKWGLGWRSG